MRIADHTDKVALHTLYNQAVLHANEVGHIDWPSPFPMKLVDELIGTNELYCFDGRDGIDGALRVSEQPDRRIWADDKPALYVSKVATSDATRGQRYFETIMLPWVVSVAGPNRAIRLDCLADNGRLKAYYVRLGFMGLADVTFYSDKQRRDITVTPFELLTV